MINYFGTKKTYDLDIPEISKIIQDNHFIDLFGGGGSVTYNKPKSVSEVWNEIYEPSYQFYKHLQNDFKTLYKRCFELTPIQAQRNLYGNITVDNLTIAASFFVYSETCFNGNAGCNWDVGLSSRKTVNLSKLHKLKRRFNDVEISNLDFRLILLKYPDHLVYADPPYVFDARGSKDNRNRNPKYTMPRRRYKHEFTEQDHIDLRYRLASRKFIVSGYESELYDDLYKDCKKIRLTEKEMLWVKLKNI